jgi:hypothetical protein
MLGGALQAFAADCVMNTERESLGDVLARLDQSERETERLLDAVHYQIVRTSEIVDAWAEVRPEPRLVWHDTLRRMRRFYRPATSEDPPQWFVDQFASQNLAAKSAPSGVNKRFKGRTNVVRARLERNVITESGD